MTREEIIRNLKYTMKKHKNDTVNTFDTNISVMCKDILDYLEQESKTGHWIEEDMFDGDVAYRCSECNELFWIESGTPKDNGYNFCPKCGKRLIEPQESNAMPDELVDHYKKLGEYYSGKDI